MNINVCVYVYMYVCMYVCMKREWLQVQQLDRQRRENTQVMIPSAPNWGWKCVPLVVETFGTWGRTAGQFFAQLAVQLAAQGNSTKATMLNSIYGRLLVRANARGFLAKSHNAKTTDLLEG